MREAKKNSMENIEKYFKIMVENSLDVITLLQLDGKVIFASPSTEEVSGFTMQELTGKSIFDLIYPEDLQKAKEALVGLAKNPGVSQTIEVRLKHKNGSWIYYEARGMVPIASSQMIIVNSRDITKRKKLEEQILKEKQEQEDILDSIPALIFYKDRENRFIHVNSTYSNMIGIPKKDLEGKSLADVFPKEQSDKFFEDDKKVIKSGKAKLGIIEEAKFPDGNHWVKTDKIPLKDENGNIVGIIGFAIDITESKEAEERQKEYLEDLEKFKNLMVGREMRMIELKQEIADLEAKLQKQTGNVGEKGEGA
jgi:PAS domain S-box-containing protein